MHFGKHMAAVSYVVFLAVWIAYGLGYAAAAHVAFAAFNAFYWQYTDAEFNWEEEKDGPE